MLAATALEMIVRDLRAEDWTEVAAIYRAGWAPRVVIVSGIDDGGVDVDTREHVLLQLRVPAEAIVKINTPARNTKEELGLAARVVPPGDDPIILVSSKSHTRRVSMTWD